MYGKLSLLIQQPLESRTGSAPRPCKLQNASHAHNHEYQKRPHFPTRRSGFSLSSFYIASAAISPSPSSVKPAARRELPLPAGCDDTGGVVTDVLVPLPTGMGATVEGTAVLVTGTEEVTSETMDEVTADVTADVTAVVTADVTTEEDATAVVVGAAVVAASEEEDELAAALVAVGIVMLTPADAHSPSDAAMALAWSEASHAPWMQDVEDEMKPEFLHAQAKSVSEQLVLVRPVSRQDSAQLGRASSWAEATATRPAKLRARTDFMLTVY